MDGSSALDRLARVGFVVKGALYMIVGVLAFQVASSAGGGRVTSTSGALTTVLGKPFGRTLLLVAAIGLLGYAVWRVLEGVLDTDHLGRDWRGLGRRAGHVIRAVVYGAIGWEAFRLHRGLSASSDSSERDLVAEAMQLPLGNWLVVLAGLGLIGYAIRQAYKAARCRLERNLDVEGMRREAGEWAVSVSRFGMAARAVVFVLIGWAVVVAGWSHDPSEVGTTAKSLRTLAEQPGGLGRWLLGSAAVGFVAYGFYQITHARYLHIRRID